MSEKDFELYRRSFGYILPSPEEALTKPYGIVAKGVYGKHFTGLHYYDKSQLETTKKALFSILESLIIKEQDKEKRLLEGFIRKIEKQDPEFYPVVNNFLKSGNFSKAFNAIKQRERNLYQLQNDFSNNLDKFSEEWAKNQNQQFLKAFRNAITGGKGGIGGRDITKVISNKMFTRTFNEILIDAREIFMREAQETASYQMIQNLDQVWDLITIYFEERLQSKGLNMNTNLRKYYKEINNKDQWVKVRTKENPGKKGQRHNKTVSQFAKQIIDDMLINGLSAEIYLTLDGGIHTGQIKKQYTSITGKNTTTGSIQSDVIELISNDFEVDVDFTNKIKSILKQEEKNIFSKIQNILNTYDNNNFIIHYSSKDLYQYSSEKRATIRGSKSFDSALEELKVISAEIDGKDITDLIFAITNTAKGLIFEEPTSVEAIKESIYAICAAWMFEDYKETFSQIKGNTNNRIHCYFVNGKYYLISEILTMILNQLRQIEERRLVYIGFTPTKRNVYGEVVKEKEKFGIERWDEVRERSLVNGKMNIRMNTEILEQILKLI